MLASMQPTDESLIGATEACDMLLISKDTLIRMIARGEIKPVHKLPGPTGAYLLNRAEIEHLARAKLAAVQAEAEAAAS